jgi:phosphate/sulfate permease
VAVGRAAVVAAGDGVSVGAAAGVFVDRDRVGVSVGSTVGGAGAAVGVAGAQAARIRIISKGTICLVFIFSPVVVLILAYIVDLLCDEFIAPGDELYRML